jgi:hypothetical protein
VKVDLEICDKSLLDNELGRNGHHGNSMKGFKGADVLKYRRVDMRHINAADLYG